MSKCYIAACRITYSNAKGIMFPHYYAATAKQAICNAVADIIVKQRLITEYIPLHSVALVLSNIDEVYS